MTTSELPPPKPENPQPNANQDQQEAAAIQDTFAASVLGVSLQHTLGKFFQPTSFKAYHDNILLSAGQPKDPVEVMLLDQLVWAHHRLGELHSQAACASTPSALEVCNAAVVRLMAECRKTSLALKEYRTPAVAKNITLVKQQNVAAGDQQVAYLDGPAQTQAAARPVNNELENKPQKAIAYEPEIPWYQESQACSSREVERVETAALYYRNPATTTRSCLEE